MLSVPFATSRPELTSQKETVGGYREERGGADAISGLSLFGPSNGGRPQHHRRGRIIYALLIFTLIEPGRPATHFTHHHQSTNSFIRTHALAKFRNVVEARKKGKRECVSPPPFPTRMDLIGWKK